MSTPTPPAVAPIVGTPGWQTTEFYVHIGTVLVIIADMIWHKDLSTDVTIFAPIAASIASFGYGLSRAITKVGVVRALAQASWAPQIEQLGTAISTVDPALKPAVATVETDVAAVETILPAVS